MNNNGQQSATEVNSNGTVVGVSPVGVAPQPSPPVSPQSSGVVTNNTTQVLPANNNQVSVSSNDAGEKKVVKEKRKINIVPLLIIIIIFLGVYIVYSSKSQKIQIQNLIDSCTPITASSEDIKLDLDSLLVKNLYSKVYTNIREDLAQPEFNDNMKLYLAYRQVLETSKYDSNCNLFNDVSMEPFTCEVSTNFVPKAFKEETLIQELKKLFGESTNIELNNIQLGNSCIGGYEYIPSRGEFVQGVCKQQNSTSFTVTKTLKEAISNRNTITIVEDVKYHENEKMSLPEFLKNGYYYYTFKLDMNYNYVFVNKRYESKY